MSKDKQVRKKSFFDKQTKVLDKQIKVLVQFTIAFYDLYTRKRKVRNSLTFFRVVSFYREFHWIQNCLSSSAYHQCIRELRFVLDSIVQAYYIDERHHDSDMPCKLEIVKEIDRWGYGGKLIEQTNLRHKQDLKDLYRELSTYVHGTHRELTSSVPKKPKKIADLIFEADGEMENLCIKLTNRTIDAIFFMTLNLFPGIFGPQAKQTRIKASFPRSMAEFECRLTLEKLANLEHKQSFQVSI
jgi:hypothetical protein